MIIKNIENTKIKIKVDPTPHKLQMNGRELHLALGRLLENDTISSNTNDIISILSKGCSILPIISIDNKVMQSLFAIDLLDIKHIPMCINIIFAYEQIGIPPFAIFKLENDNNLCSYRLLFATNIPLYNKNDIDKMKAILRAIANKHKTMCKCPYIIDGELIKTYSYYGDIRVDAKTALNNFQPSYKKYILNDSVFLSKIRYPKNWFKNNNYH